MDKETSKGKKRELNPPQKKAVEACEGPVLIFAGAGSGKTMVITHRIAKLLEKGVSPFNILAVTFTNKAAEEMKNRIKRLVGDNSLSVWVSTFHSMCLRILRQDGGKEFTVYDEHDQLVALKEVLKRLKIDPKKYPPPKLREIISNTKNNLMDPESYKINASIHSDSRKYIIGRVYEAYQNLLSENSGYDFADLIVETINLLKNNEEVLNKYQDKFKYILVDEYQDTNYAQYILLKLLAPPQNNICVVGDDDQCIAEGTKINSGGKLISVEKLKEKDFVICASGWGKLYREKCTKVFSRQYKGKIVRITTKTGNILSVTPNHIVFAKIKPVQGIYYVYLMYKDKYGFRIGVTPGVRSKRKSNNIVSGLTVRLNQENADKIWIIKICKSQKKALYFEQYYACKYGILTYTFHARGRKLVLKQKDIDNLFNNIDTYTRAAELMKDLLLDPSYPHVVAGGYINNHINRKIINFTMFGENRACKSRPWHAHRIQLNTSDLSLQKELQLKGFNTRSARKKTWRIEISRKDYDDARKLVKNLTEAKGVSEVKKARLTSGKSFLYMPASHIRTGMYVPVIKGNKVVEDIVTNIIYEEYEGYVYDISIPNLRNYAADGFVVHNSIYSWRGADIRNILEFEKNYKKAVVVKLEENYRSTQNILDAAYNVIKYNESRKNKKLWTKREKGDAVKFQEFLTNREEALGVVSEINRLVSDESYKPSELAIFYRVNAQSRSFEDVLRSAGLNYRIIGGVRFYERKEIKDILAYMKILVNNKDDISFSRIINCPPRGIGDKTLQELKNLAITEGKSLFELVMTGSGSLSEKIHKKLEPLKTLFSRLQRTLQKDEPALLAKEIIEFSGYHRMIEAEDDIQAQSRIENIEELVSAFSEEENSSRSVNDIINEITLLTDIDSWRQDEDYVTLMTVHLAKGLEFPAVFLTGLEEELFPHYDALRDPAQMEEERRLCYVGMTRAKDLLYLTAASQRMLYGQSRWHIPSRFIKESMVNDNPEEKEYNYDQ